MLLAQKLADFVAGEPLKDAISITGSDLANANHKSSTRSAGYYFEQDSELRSDWLTPMVGGFGFLGAHSYMNDDGYIRGPVFIGRYCSIGRRVTIGAGGHRLQGLSTSPRIQGSHSRPYRDGELDEIRATSRHPLKTVICSDVWIGDGAIIMPGVTVSEGAVVGANAVVTKDVGPYEIVGGVPSKQLKRRFPPDIAERLLESRWWEHPHDLINALPTRNIFEFLEQVGDIEKPTTGLKTYFHEEAEARRHFSRRGR